MGRVIIAHLCGDIIDFHGFILQQLPGLLNTKLDDISGKRLSHGAFEQTAEVRRIHKILFFRQLLQGKIILVILLHVMKDIPYYGISPVFQGILLLIADFTDNIHQIFFQLFRMLENI